MPGLFFEIAVPVEGDSLVVDGPRPSPGRARPSTTTCWALRPGQQAYCSGGRSASKIGSSTSIAAVMQTRSRKVKMPSGLSLQPRPVTVYRDTLTEGFSHFVTSIAAPVASGWSDCRGRDRGTARVLQIFPRIPWTPAAAVDKVRLPVSSLVTSAFPKSQWVGSTTSIRSTTSERGVLTRLQSFVNLQASEFAAIQVVPTAGTPFGYQGGRGVYVRAERGSLPPRASDMLVVRNRAIDGRGLSPPRSAALLAAPGICTHWRAPPLHGAHP